MSPSFDSVNTGELPSILIHRDAKSPSFHKYDSRSFKQTPL